MKYRPMAEWDIDYLKEGSPYFREPPRYYASSMQQPIRDFAPHYTNERFNHSQTIWLASGSRLSRTQYAGEVVNGAVYDYSDRLDSWYGYEKSREAWRKAMADNGCTTISNITAAAVQAYLRDLTDDPQLRLVHILAGVNVSNGYPYQVFGYVPGKKQDNPNDSNH